MLGIQRKNGDDGGLDDFPGESPGSFGYSVDDFTPGW